MTLQVGSDNSNCLTYTPDYINVTLSNGSLVLKAGSKVFIPNGFEQDGTTFHFDEHEVASDCVNTDYPESTTDLFMWQGDGITLSGWPVTLFYAGTTEPTDSGTWLVWWDWNINKVKAKLGASTWTVINYSLPVCRAYGANSAVTTLYEVFKWCGFMGSAAFTLPGIRGRIADGLNSNGTNKYVEFETTRVLYTNRTWTMITDWAQQLTLFSRGTVLGITNHQFTGTSLPNTSDNTFSIWYNPVTNIQKVNTTGTNYTTASQWVTDSTEKHIASIPSDGTERIISMGMETAQPLTTTFGIEDVYLGSDNTNCITSVPDDFTLTYNAGDYTLKAGSKIIVPYGGGPALTPGQTLGKFKVVKYIGSYLQLELINDFTATFGGTTSTLYMLTLGFTSSGEIYWSGTVPENNTAGSTDSRASQSDGCLWFDTTNKVIYRRYSDGTTGYRFGGGNNGAWLSLPLAVHYGTPTSAVQIFKWCGYLGQCQFVLPGVKGLQSNGFKADGTYNNINVEINDVLLNLYTYQAVDQQVGLNSASNSLWRTGRYYSQGTAPALTTYSIWHNTTDNFNYYIGDDTNTGWVKTNNYAFPIITSISTAATTFNVQPFTPATTKPLTTLIPISEIYNGSDLVYSSKYPSGTVLFEKGTAGTYTLTVKKDCTVSVRMIGGGGGGAHSDSYGAWSNNQTGGSAGMITGTISLAKGTYTIVVGGVGEGRYSSNGGGGATSSATAGGATTFNGNSANGGGGAYTHTGYFDSRGRAGAAGTTSVVTSGLSGSNGAAGSATSRWGSYGGGGSAGANGQSGYCSITVV